MSTGYAVLGTCWPVQADALVAHCVGSYPLSGADVNGAFVVSCAGTVSGGLSLVRADSAGAAAPVTVATVYAPCDTGSLASIVPTPEALGVAFSFGFAGVVICFLLAWQVGQVLGVIKD